MRRVYVEQGIAYLDAGERAAPEYATEYRTQAYDYGFGEERLRGKFIVCGFAA